VGGRGGVEKVGGDGGGGGGEGVGWGAGGGRGGFVMGGGCSVLGCGWGLSSRWRRGYAGRVVFLQRQVLYDSVNVSYPASFPDRKITAILNCPNTARCLVLYSSNPPTPPLSPS
jgi:hypothetical protein